MGGRKEGELRAGGFISAIFGEDEGDVVVLLVRAEAVDVLDDAGHGGLRGGMAVAGEGLNEAVFAELFAGGVGGFGDAIGVERESVAAAEMAFADGAIPVLEDAQDGGGGVEALDGAVAAEQ